MTDKEKLEAIKAEIHRLVDVRGYDREMANDLFAFIDSLPNEPVSEELEKAAEEYVNSTLVGSPYIKKNAYKAGAKWQKEQFEKNRLKHCNSITNEQAELEQVFIDQHLDKHQRMPTFLDAIEYGMRLQKEQMMAKAVDSTVLNGTVEMDEMYLGGRETNKHESKRTEGTQGRSTKTKTPIFGMIEREKGTVVAMKVENTQGKTLMPIVSQFVEEGSTTYTDEASIYNKLSENGYDHLFVNHGKREYVRANDIHTNGIEGFWAHFKRVVFGTYHCVSKDYVQRYIDEQTYRWNTREEKASYRFHDMFKKAIKQFDYNNVLELSSVVDTEYRTFKHNVYFHWYDHKHRVA